MPAKHAQKVVWVLQLLEEQESVSIKYFKHLVNTDGIWEVRAQQGSNNFRLLGFLHKDSLVILTNGFSKKTQKTPKREIVLAEKRKYNWLMRYGNE